MKRPESVVRAHIAEQCAKISKLNEELSEARATFERLREELVDVTDGVKIGSVVKWNGSLFKVVGISRILGTFQPWLLGNKQNKDGKWSKAVQSIYDGWELIES